MKCVQNLMKNKKDSCTQKTI